ncbi:nitrous oxide-stimulated promoter family protein [Enterococcus wangshanyuanii]|uniref:Nitrous oxide-stimulated promoter n=1 Tax=Enterococcus wangshanyuanii TaxID=2005703 RepID=A0ABQ1P3P7_9ENTE|nr:nitrous oxide-stimulated promoter family protein [Enterococcus wangshanyuanii]GGC90152.1 hypothetical protein GCM10011573_19710 [Enterococcus wangshanyuanii]
MRQKNTGPVIMEEIRLMEVMIQVYYAAQVETDIPEERMLNYARTRLEFCQFGEEKTTCQRCPVHCYQPKYREQMKKVMRYSGPRMLVRHPILTIKHGYRGFIRKVEQ